MPQKPYTLDFLDFPWGRHVARHTGNGKLYLSTFLMCHKRNSLVPSLLELFDQRCQMSIYWKLWLKCTWNNSTKRYSLVWTFHFREGFALSDKSHQQCSVLLYGWNQSAFKVKDNQLNVNFIVMHTFHTSMNHTIHTLSCLWTNEFSTFNISYKVPPHLSIGRHLQDVLVEPEPSAVAIFTWIQRLFEQSVLLNYSSKGLIMIYLNLFLLFTKAYM